MCLKANIDFIEGYVSEFEQSHDSGIEPERFVVLVVKLPLRVAFRIAKDVVVFRLITKRCPFPLLTVERGNSGINEREAIV